MDRKVCVAVAAPIVFFYLSECYVNAEMPHTPPQAIGALTVQSSVTASTSIDVRFVPDMVIDNVYEVCVAPIDLRPAIRST